MKEKPEPNRKKYVADGSASDRADCPQVGRLPRHESTAIVSVTTPGFDSDCVCVRYLGCRGRNVAYSAERTLRHWPTGTFVMRSSPTADGLFGADAVPQGDPCGSAQSAGTRNEVWGGWLATVRVASRAARGG